MKIRYLLGNTLDELEKHVNRAFTEGAKLQGDIVATHDFHGRNIYIQAVVYE